MTMGFAVRSLQVDEGGLMQGTLQTSSYNGDWYSLARIYETSKCRSPLFAGTVLMSLSYLQVQT